MADNLSDAVYRKLQKQILDKTYPPGSRFPSERDLAEALGVSRVTVREAVRRLAELGLVNKIPSSGTYVREFESEASLDLLVKIMQSRDSLDPDMLSSLLEFRRATEVFAARAAALRASREETAELRAILAEMENRLEDADFLAQADYRFHFALIRISGNRVFRLILNAFKPVYTFYTRFFYGLEEMPRRSILFFRKLVSALESKDELFAAYIMEKMLEYAENRVKEETDLFTRSLAGEGQTK
ncbi:MAG: FadR family transcriptional regulator [Desulfobacterales bacterium]|nr:FadR family transcriptional regulator [Desulfobacterales bacterium]